MAYLIDTDILIYSIKNHSVVYSQFRKNTNIPKAVSVISYGELVFGARKSKNIEKNLAVVHQIAEIFPVIEISKSVVETFGDLKALLQKKGISISDLDLLIASTALTMNYCLVSNNESHFKKIPGLKIENWTKENR